MEKWARLKGFLSRLFLLAVSLGALPMVHSLGDPTFVSSQTSNAEEVEK
jgi:hypothetical protein